MDAIAEFQLQLREIILTARRLKTITPEGHPLPIAVPLKTAVEIVLALDPLESLIGKFVFVGKAA